MASSSSLVFFIFTISMFSHFTPSLSQRCHPDDKAALLEIKKSLGDPYVLISWKLDVDCCSWLTVTCDETTNRITRLEVFQSTVAGTLSPAIGELTSLQFVDLNHLTGLKGGIPPAICSLKSLTFLRLSKNQLSGQIPACIGGMTGLTFLDVSYNELCGKIPAGLERFNAMYFGHNKCLCGSPLSVPCKA